MPLGLSRISYKVSVKTLDAITLYSRVLTFIIEIEIDAHFYEQYSYTDIIRSYAYRIIILITQEITLPSTAYPVLEVNIKNK